MVFAIFSEMINDLAMFDVSTQHLPLHRNLVLGWAMIPVYKKNGNHCQDYHQGDVVDGEVEIICYWLINPRGRWEGDGKGRTVMGTCQRRAASDGLFPNVYTGSHGLSCKKKKK